MHELGELTLEQLIDLKITSDEVHRNLLWCALIEYRSTCGQSLTQQPDAAKNTT